MSSGAYDTWSKEDLISRIKTLESQRHNLTRENRKQARLQRSLRNISPSRTNPRTFDFSSFHKRKIALKFCYSGWEYSGLAYQTAPTPLPTVEGVLFDALRLTRLVDPEGSMEDCGWDKCGRTDAGVSAAGQVISLYVRSAQPKPKTKLQPESRAVTQEALDSDEDSAAFLDDGFGTLNLSDSDEPSPLPRHNKLRGEYDYIEMLNHILPPSIRILAWSPVSDDFSARFHCKKRHYKYFFDPTGLDLVKMQEAATLLEGGHDFRNFCRLDKTKQLTVFERTVISAKLAPAKDMHVLDLTGSAFLYNQVRHIMAVLFLVGIGREDPSVVTTMLNVSEGREGPDLEVLDRKPAYQIAEALPLMLWDCTYDEGLLDWQTTQFEFKDHEIMKSMVEKSRVVTVVKEHFLQAAEAMDSRPSAPRNGPVVFAPLGAGAYKRFGVYVPLLKRVRLDTVEVRNERWKHKSQKAKAKGRVLVDDDDDNDE